MAGKWLCSVCNIYVYDEEKGDSLTGISPGTKVSDFPDSWRCPVCGAAKDKLVQIPDEEYWHKARVYTDFTRKKGLRACLKIWYIFGFHTVSMYIIGYERVFRGIFGQDYSIYRWKLILSIL
ncbi:Rubredoxin [uncultured archaeon]|nr:Rubredoxin [uncultured archaeon]